MRRTYTLSNFDGNPHDGPSGTVVGAIPISQEQIEGHEELDPGS